MPLMHLHDVGKGCGGLEAIEVGAKNIGKSKRCSEPKAEARHYDRR
jgi:hypothetical protein